MLRLLIIEFCFLAAFSVAGTAADGDRGWSDPVAVTLGSETCVTYRAAWRGDWLIIRADHQKGWHSYALDNQVRVDEQLAGRPALGVEAPTEIEVGGAELTGTWRQTPPHDLSKPELRWYRFGFSGRAYFAVQLAPGIGSHAAGAEPLQIGIRGQVCDERRCQRVDVQLTVSPTAEPIDCQPAELEPVKTTTAAQNSD